ncbi:MAG: YtxH domain-containing protein [Gemmatimonadota bacterium]
MDDHDGTERVLPFLAGLVLGAAIGAGVALLTAPQPGTRTRKRIRRAAHTLKDGAVDRWDDLADDMKQRVDDTVRAARKRLPT